VMVRAEFTGKVKLPDTDPFTVTMNVSGVALAGVPVSRPLELSENPGGSPEAVQV
jgi:hypothetical protein